MKILRLIQDSLGFIPLLWSICFILILSIGYFSLGVMPEYGNINDPYSLGIAPLSLLHVILFIIIV